jgi:hypothetical protein
MTRAEGQLGSTRKSDAGRDGKGNDEDYLFARKIVAAGVVAQERSGEFVKGQLLVQRQDGCM